MNNELLRYLRVRRSPKLSVLEEPAPSDDQLRGMLEIASRTPDHGKLVPWRFVIIAGHRRGELGEVIARRFVDINPDAPAERVDFMNQRVCKAPLVVAVVFQPKPHAKIPEWEQMLTAGAVCMNLLHAANSLGFAGLWLSEWYAYDRVVLDELGLSPDEQLAGFIHIGTPSESRDDRARPVMDEIVTAY
ncbi:MAG: nitroreductase [Planctomycetota bacterium]